MWAAISQIYKLQATRIGIYIASKVWGHMIFSGGGGVGGALPIGGWEGGDRYNLNNPKQSFTILSKVEGLTPDNLHSSAQTQHLHVL